MEVQGPEAHLEVVALRAMAKATTFFVREFIRILEPVVHVTP
jgi:hypothetical protein